MNESMLLPVYLLLVAGFLMYVNIHAAKTATKQLSYLGMWAALIASVVIAFKVLR